MIREEAFSFLRVCDDVVEMVQKRKELYFKLFIGVKVRREVADMRLPRH